MSLKAQVAVLTAERDEAREWVRRLTSRDCTLTCVYCGHAYPPGTPEHGSSVLTEHIASCEKHPMRAAELLLDRYRALAKAADDLRCYGNGYGVEYVYGDVYGDAYDAARAAVREIEEGK